MMEGAVCCGRQTRLKIWRGSWANGMDISTEGNSYLAVQLSFVCVLEVVGNRIDFDVQQYTPILRMNERLMAVERS